MRGLTAVGFLVAFSIVGVLAIQGMKSEASRTAPTGAIDRAQGAAETMEKQAEKLQPDLDR
ncbi:hypothetical protein [Pseudanabaena sp. FACHB-2040]|uniref:hypothetical protein n=1 Tax=Pseudanabaena sp. FACHB-2040 TaxID=2692859 RepID=UPI0016823405|nr:hypothetical protein [Pseudanabaena sp. FACHB-2040]MBD2256404.1 hypothetical protein [Pseudanabaena sp. FACHB-2040]